MPAGLVSSVMIAKSYRSLNLVIAVSAGATFASDHDVVPKVMTGSWFLFREENMEKALARLSRDVSDTCSFFLHLSPSYGTADRRWRLKDQVADCCFDDVALPTITP